MFSIDPSTKQMPYSSQASLDSTTEKPPKKRVKQEVEAGLPKEISDQDWKRPSLRDLTDLFLIRQSPANQISSHLPSPLHIEESDEGRCHPGFSELQSETGNFHALHNRTAQQSLNQAVLLPTSGSASLLEERLLAENLAVEISELQKAHAKEFSQFCVQFEFNRVYLQDKEFLFWAYLTGHLTSEKTLKLYLHQYDSEKALQALEKDIEQWELRLFLPKARWRKKQLNSIDENLCKGMKALLNVLWTLNCILQFSPSKRIMWIQCLGDFDPSKEQVLYKQWYHRIGGTDGIGQMQARMGIRVEVATQQLTGILQDPNFDIKSAKEQIQKIQSFCFSMWSSDYKREVSALLGNPLNTDKKKAKNST
jgi:hypothetical protein